MTKSPLVVVKWARKLSGACAVKPGSAGLWKSGRAALAVVVALLGEAGAASFFLHPAAAATASRMMAVVRIRELLLGLAVRRCNEVPRSGQSDGLAARAELANRVAGDAVGLVAIGGPAVRAGRDTEANG